MGWCWCAWGSAQPAGLCDVDKVHACMEDSTQSAQPARLVGLCWCACMHVLRTASQQHSLQDGVMTKCIRAGQHRVSTACRTGGLVPPVVSMHACRTTPRQHSLQDCMWDSTTSAQPAGLCDIDKCMRYCCAYTRCTRAGRWFVICDFQVATKLCCT
jgi:hypothetical protein